MKKHTHSDALIPEGDRSKIVVHVDADLEAIVPAFLANRRRDLTTIASCLEQGDLSTIGLLGHRMKGDGGGYGFDQISAIGHQLEQAAMAKDRASITSQITLLKDFLSKLTVIYKS